MPVVKAAAVQLSPVLYSREGTVGKVVKKILELGRQGVQFATFPETVVPYYPYFSFVQAPYEMGAEHYKLLDQAVTVRIGMSSEECLCSNETPSKHDIRIPRKRKSSKHREPQSC